MKKTHLTTVVSTLLLTALFSLAGIQIVTVDDTGVKPEGLLMLATNNVTRLFSASGSQYIDGTGGVWRVTSGVGGWSVYVPNSDTTFSASGLVFPLQYPFYYEYADGDWTLIIERSEGDIYDVQVVSLSGDYYAANIAITNTAVEITSSHELPPAVLSPSGVGAVTSHWDGVAFSSHVVAATQGLASAAALVSLAPYTWVSGALTSATQGLVTAAITNGLGGTSFDPAATNGLATLAQLYSATGGLVNASVTNGLAPVSVAAGKLDRVSGTATNMTLQGTTTLRNTAATNLVVRLFLSNEIIYAEHILP